ncbi:MAG: hypothetical protein STSR0008_26330 [Ignavibacterium sp.]
MFSKGDVLAGAKAIKTLIDNPALRITLGMNGKNAIMKKYNSESFGKRMNDIYKSLIINSSVLSFENTKKIIENKND